jgi:hypothetical protein
LDEEHLPVLFCGGMYCGLTADSEINGLANTPEAQTDLALPLLREPLVWGLDTAQHLQMLDDLGDHLGFHSFAISLQG